VPRVIRGDAAGKIALSRSSGEREWLPPLIDRMEARIERLAPGFRDSILGRHCFGPSGLQSENANLSLGAIGGGTAQLHQQLIFRPVPGSGRSETPIPNLFLASASAHPGPGVHGAAGANAARAALLPFSRPRSVVFGRGRPTRPGSQPRSTIDD
jgi:phytoene dehydrogenase-like protein